MNSSRADSLTEVSNREENAMTAPDRLQIAREMYRAYETGDRDLIEPHLSENLTFYSPADPGIDRTR
jgi:hypothetical protein